MFTGLVQEVGEIRSLVPHGAVTRIDLVATRLAPRLRVGDSLAVNGICLTVTQRRDTAVRVEAAAETRRVTTLPFWRPGDRVHLEPALRAGDPLGGHHVLGHVDTVGKVLRNGTRSGSWFLTVQLEPAFARYLLTKGSVAVDGVSLTVDEGPFLDRFTVNVIPHTLANTCLKSMRSGTRVNLEMDVLVKAARGEGWAREKSVATSSDTSSRLTLAGLLARGYRRPKR